MRSIREHVKKGDEIDSGYQGEITRGDSYAAIEPLQELHPLKPGRTDGPTDRRAD